jgi:hypothetical protein
MADDTANLIAALQGNPSAADMAALASQRLQSQSQRDVPQYNMSDPNPLRHVVGPSMSGIINGLAHVVNIPQQAIQGAQYDVTHPGASQAVGPAADAAMLMAGGGTPMAEEGALGAAGGRTVMPGGQRLRGVGGKYIKPEFDARGIPNPFVPDKGNYAVPKPGEVMPTAEPNNPMYNAQTAPDMTAANKMLERQQSDKLNVNPADVERWKAQLGNGFGTMQRDPAQLLSDLLKNPDK